MLLNAEWLENDMVARTAYTLSPVIMSWAKLACMKKRGIVSHLALAVGEFNFKARDATSESMSHAEQFQRLNPASV